MIRTIERQVRMPAVRMWAMYCRARSALANPAGYEVGEVTTVAQNLIP